MTRKELIQNLLDGKKMTSDELTYPDKTYIYYEEVYGNPFRFLNNDNESIPISFLTIHGDYREVKEKPYVNPKTGIEDKAFIEMWDKDSFCRVHGFYDAINNCTFDYNGTRDSYAFDNYKVIEDIPDWAIEAKKLLKE